MSSNNSTTMAELMAKYKAPLVTVHKGEIIKGKITKLTSSEILLDINAKTEAVVMENDKKLLHAMLAALHVGDTVEAQILNPESDNGNTVVSLRRFMEDKVWEQLAQIQKTGEKIQAHITGITKGGYLISTPQGIDGFLPNSHVSFNQDTQDLVGKTLPVMIAELNKETRKLIVSQKPILGQADFDALAKKLKVGEKVDAIVSHVTSFGIFVSLPIKDKKEEETFLDGFIHISEVAWEKVTDLNSLFEVGQAVEAVVIGMDIKNKRIELSIKKLTADPFEELLKQYAVDQKVTGIVEKVTEAGVLLTLGKEGQEVEGFIRKEKIPPTKVYAAGEKVTATVTDVDTKKHRVYIAPVLLDKPLMYR